MAAGGVVAVAVLVLLLARSGAGGDAELPYVTVPPSVPAGPSEVFVHVAGAVRHPGLYRIAPGGRVADAVGAAGGVLPGAQPDLINLAAPLADGSRVWVPSEVEPEDPLSEPVGGPVGRPLDVNQATASELEALPGVGPALAAAIVEHRQRSGPFASVDDLLAVPGIGPAKLAGFRDLVTV